MYNQQNNPLVSNFTLKQMKNSDYEELLEIFSTYVNTLTITPEFSPPKLIMCLLTLRESIYKLGSLFCTIHAFSTIFIVSAAEVL